MPAQLVTSETPDAELADRFMNGPVSEATAVLNEIARRLGIHGPFEGSLGQVDALDNYLEEWGV